MNRSLPEGRFSPPLTTTRRKLLAAFGLGALGSVGLYRGFSAFAAGEPRRTIASPNVFPMGPNAGPPLNLGPGIGDVGTDLEADIEAEIAPSAPRQPVSLDPETEPPGEDHIYDIVIAGGRVIDPESGFDGLANVGIDGSVITEISPLRLNARRVIRADGRVVAPGFIDLLSYEPNEFGAWLKLSDGVTTNLAMHGVGNYAERFFKRYEGRSPVHYGGAFHHHFLRGFDIGADIAEPLTASQIGAMEQLARASLDYGFAGISFSPEYSPGTSTTEMEVLARLAAEFGHVCFFHLRHSDPDEPDTSLEALDEAIGIARRSGCSIHIEHLTSTGGTHVMAEALQRIETARSGGIDVSACVYPYNFWGTFLASQRFSEGWQKRYRITGNDLQIAGTAKRVTSDIWDEAVAANYLVAALDSIPEEEIELALRKPWVVIASDAIITESLNNHPRGAGTFARTLAEYVRSRRVLDLRTGLAKMTVLPALRVQAMLPEMARKGRIQRGADADIVVFDPVAVADRATVAEPGLASVGIDWVLVDGQVALADGEPDRNVVAGRALRSARRTGGTA